ncbi:MAG TPA: cytochrome c [Vicinamibacteria bacterium]|nr:cytochrome c [Vicinamibacteria bacterium]
MRAGTALALALSWAVTGEAHKPSTTEYTYHRDIYPIFFEKCGSCHRTGGVAPMSLLRYKDAYPWAASIKNELLKLAMPPWFADERYGAFKHGLGLTGKELDTVVDWCLGGTPEGDTVERIGEDEAASGWALGAPDLELSMNEPAVLGPEQSEAVRELTLGELAQEKHLRAIDVRPGAPSIVRSALVFAGDSLIGAWTAGARPESLSAGRGFLVPKGTKISLRLQYRKTWLNEGNTVEDVTTLALYFQDEIKARVVPLSVDPGGYRLVRDVEVLALVPRVEERSPTFLAEALKPDGSREPLIRLNEPNPDFPRAYWLETPLYLPSGTRVDSSHPLVLNVVLR